MVKEYRDEDIVRPHRDMSGIMNYTALKGIVSNVIDPGYEPRSEYRPDEEISILMAPGAVLARKTPSVILSMFTNKVLIELKRHLKEDYLRE